MELLMVLRSHAFSCVSSRPSRSASGYFSDDMFDILTYYTCLRARNYQH